MWFEGGSRDGSPGLLLVGTYYGNVLCVNALCLLFLNIIHIIFDTVAQ